MNCRMKNQIPRCPFGTSRGFTLLELMVGVAILALLVVFLSGIFGSVSKTWQLGQSNSERLQNIRGITDFITTELRTALLPVNRTDKANLQLILNPSALSTEYQNPDALFWQAPVASGQALSDVAEVGYFVKWDSAKSNNPRPILCRFYVDDSTKGANYLIYSQGGGSTPWLSDAIVAAVAPADKNNAYEGLVGENVVAFFVQCGDAKGQPIDKTYAGGSFTGTNLGFDSRQGYTDSLGVKTADFTDSTGKKAPISVLPPMVKLSFVLIDSKSAAKIGPGEKAALVTLASAIASKTPKGDANDFVKAALGMPGLNGISPGLRAFQTEINLLNAR
jgi:prepilin-type N-terminal cleavage/methylation domain-containing protein